MRKVGFFLAAGMLLLSTIAIAQPDDGARNPGQVVQQNDRPDFDGLSSHERKMAAQVPNCRVVQRENIVVLYPASMEIIQIPETGVSNPEQLANWLELVYRLMREWTFHDPNVAYQQKNGERHRLAFVWNGKKHFIFGGVKRPYIALVNPPNDANWFGYICHEISHDFLHVHPDFRDRLTGWNEAACDYSRYHVLRAIGMTNAAQQWERDLYRADPNSRYRGKARQMLDLERRMGWRGPAEFWRKLKGQDINILISGQGEEYLTPTEDATEALVAAWDFEATDPLVDKAPAGQTRDDLTISGDATIENGKAILDGAAALRAASSADLEMTGEMTVWARFRVRGSGSSILGLVDKRRFKSPEARSYGLVLLPSGQAWGLGGQISGDGTRALALTITRSAPFLPINEWREAAMVVRRIGDFLSVSWLTSTGEREADMAYVLANGPASVATLGTIYSDSQPLFIGNDANLKPKSAALEFDEVRLYNRALTTDELLAIVPGELSHAEEGSQ